MRVATALTPAFAWTRQKIPARMRSVWLAVGVIVFAGLAWNRDWLTAAGLTPIVLGVLPCAAMKRLVVRFQHLHPIAARIFANVGIKEPLANTMFLVERI